MNKKLNSAILILVGLSAVNAQEPTSMPYTPNAREARAENVFRVWCRRLLTENWRPKAKTSVAFFREGDEGYPVDIIRSQFKVGEKDVTISQTRCIMSVKIEGVDFEQPGVPVLNIVTQLAKELFLNSDALSFEFKDEKRGVGRAKGEPPDVSPFLGHLEFAIEGKTLRIYGLKHRDGPSPAVLSRGYSTNSKWFTPTDDKKLDVEDPKHNDYADEIMAAVLR